MGPIGLTTPNWGRWMTENLIIIGFDSEWVALDGVSNHVLSYQYAVKVGAAWIKAARFSSKN